jgi:hypothetical protein
MLHRQAVRAGRGVNTLVCRIDTPVDAWLVRRKIRVSAQLQMTTGIIAGPKDA